MSEVSEALLELVDELQLLVEERRRYRAYQRNDDWAEMFLATLLL